MALYIFAFFSAVGIAAFVWVLYGFLFLRRGKKAAVTVLFSGGAPSDVLRRHTAWVMSFFAGSELYILPEDGAKLADRLRAEDNREA